MTTYRNREHAGAWRFASEESTCPVLLVGEDNPLSVEPHYALYPYPVGCAGYRFAENIANTGMGVHTATWRTNLCSPRWSSKAARARATALLDAKHPWTVIVMLGRKVAEAFASALTMPGRPRTLEFPPFTKHDAIVDVLGGMDDGEMTIIKKTLLALPHPSGRNTIWNRPDQVLRARALLADVAPTWYGECNT